ncbi:MAG TPA: GNAT family N-acetyltransferase [Candidatus Nanoarchaeia archaeon]|nr:GNAT family N-acetyltransferase [Candidatus Nanoarchaeia archaeon]
MIRKATKKDLPALYDLYTYFVGHLMKARPTRYGLDRINPKSFGKEFEALINGSTGNILVFEEKGRIAGYGIGKIVDSVLFVKQKQHGELYQIVVREESQNKGIGKALANELINWMKSKGVTLIYGLVDLNNKESLRVWGKLGFRDELVYIAKDSN